MPIYFSWFITALPSVSSDTNNHNLPQSGRLLYCVLRRFCSSNLIKRYPLLSLFHLPPNVTSSLNLRLLVRSFHWPRTTTLVESGHRSPVNRGLSQAALSSLNLLKTMQLENNAAAGSALALGLLSFSES